VPTPSNHEILVKVKAAGVNPLDWKVREGWLKERVHFNLPITLGWDVAGVVEEVGREVTKFKKGDAIYSRPDIAKDGAYAEYIVIAENEAALKPSSLTFIQAAGVPLAALTAWEALFTQANLTKGQQILIHAAVGGVGSFAVQFAKDKGCTVYGTVSTKNIDLAKKIGVDTVIDYTKQNFSEIAKNLDMVLDTIGGETQQDSFKCLKSGGVLITTVDTPDQKLADKYGVTAKWFMVSANGTVLSKIAKLIDAHKITPLIDQVFTLEQVKEAQALSQSGHAQGKIILKIAD